MTFWWFDYGHPTLFTTAVSERLESRLHVVIDANVFFDLHDDQPGLCQEESKSLLADWLKDDLELCVTDEIFNEINRSGDTAERHRQRRRAETFSRLPCENERFDPTCKSIRDLFPEHLTPSDESDLRQLARAIASDARFFVTRDDRLLGLADTFYSLNGISVIRPSDLIVHLDKLHEEMKYQPASLAGAIGMVINVIQGGQEATLTDCFLCSPFGEPKAEFQSRLRRFLADPKRFECNVVLDVGKTPIALIVYDRARAHELTVHILRVKRGPMATSLLRHLLLRSILVSSSEHRVFTRIVDPYLDKDVNAGVALHEDAFVRVDGCWLKVNLAGAETATELSRRLANLCLEGGKEYAHCQKLADALRNQDPATDTQTMAELEHLLWPGKIIDASIPTFIVPIRPPWALDLFDHKLARQSIFGRSLDLALNREAVYYRASRPGGLSAPARILWYVSTDRRYREVGSIRACSRLDEVAVGKPKMLFRQFRRLGVYDWRRVLDVAKSDEDADIMAIRFSGTELFAAPIPWNDLQRILAQARCKSQLQSPCRIPDSVFSTLYQLGTQCG